MEKRWDCLSVGLAVADHLCQPIDHLPRAGELVVAERLELAVGGCAANVAVDLARLRVNVGIVARIGDDLFGEYIQRQMESSGVLADTLCKTPGVETSGTLIVNVQNQDRRFIHAFGANARFDGSELSDEQILQSRVLYLGGYFAMPQLEPSTVRHWFETARSGSVKTVLDVVIPGPGDYRSALQTILPATDYFLPNRDEAEVMTGLKTPLEQAKLFREWGAHTVIITDGAEGAIALSPSGSWKSGVFPIDYVDGTGSGDAFDAGVIYGLLEGGNLQRCIQLGTALGASAVRKSSATAGIFTPSELSQFLHQHPFSFTPL